MKIAVFLPNWIGDVVMATPALRALRDHHRDAEIVGIMRPYVTAVLDGTNLVDRVLIHDPKSSDADSSHHGLSFWGTLRREQFDLAVVLPNSWRSAFLAWVSGAKRTLGYARNGRELLLTDAIPAPSQSRPHPVLDEMLQLVAQLGCRSLSRRIELATTEQDEQQLATFWRKHPHCDSSRFVALNTGGAFGAAKDWPVESFTELARRLANEQSQTVLVVCGPNERTTAKRIVTEAAHPRVISLAEEPCRIGLTKAAIRHAQLLVTTDSGPRHFGAAFDVPTLTLFGPTHIAWSESFHPQAVHLQQPVPCGPCQQGVCPLGHHRCMTELSVNNVFQTILRHWPRMPHPVSNAA